jgi:hydroxypyruvate reductase
MAQAIEALEGLPPLSGIITTKYGFGGQLQYLELREAGHPIPDDASQAAAEATLEWAATADEATLVLLLISGGGSSLWAAPQSAPGAAPDNTLSLGSYQEITNQLLRSGAAIEEINTVRKHLTRLSGGRLAQALAPASGVALVLSDVLGDPLEAISSGPAAADSTTYAQAKAVLMRYGLWEQLPHAASAVLEAGEQGQLPETLKPYETQSGLIEHCIIGNNRQACEMAVSHLEYAGAEVVLEAQALRGAVEQEARGLLTRAIQHRSGSDYPGPIAMVAGGEVSVKVEGSGTGGRQQQFALEFLGAIAQLPPQQAERVFLLAAATDGNDGPTDAAGAFADQAVLEQAKTLALDWDSYRRAQDAYHFFQATEALFITGPSGTNLNDFFIVWIE